jgi:hypothetical protein
MLSNSNTFLSREAGALSGFSAHSYAGNPASNPPSDYLLKPRASTLGPSTFLSAIGASHERHLPFRITEINSFFGFGVHGLSDAFSSALWSVDTMFEYANAGVDGVNWEADGANFCSPFSFAKTMSGDKNEFALKSATPLYYGLLLFQAATGRGARMLSVQASTRANLKAWATLDDSGTVRLVIINKDPMAQGTVNVSIPNYEDATILRLEAPSYTSLSGVSFGGRTLDGSADGKFVGHPISETLHGNRGRFQVSMPITSAALVIFRK